MILQPQEVRARIDQQKLSYNGYNRQLSNLSLSNERRERLEVEVEVLSEEIATLEKLLGVLRVELDGEKVEEIVRDRLAQVRQRLSEDATFGGLEEAQWENASGEARALLWALGEDILSVGMRVVLGKDGRMGPSRVDRALPNMLISGLRSRDSDPNARASAAYEIGVLHVVEAIPFLADALTEGGELAQIALLALARFSDGELSGAGLPGELIERIRQSKSK